MAPREAETQAQHPGQVGGPHLTTCCRCAHDAQFAAPRGAETHGLSGSLQELGAKEHRSGLVSRLRPEGAALSLWLSGGARFVAGFGLDILVG